jgi:hypothetical protein
MRAAEGTALEPFQRTPLLPNPLSEFVARPALGVRS